MIERGLQTMVRDKRNAVSALVVTCLLGLGAAGKAGEGLPIPPEDFAKIMAAIKPADDQSKYLDEIPWVGSLWEARKEAAAEGKPLFIFATTRHPLGES